MFIVGMLEPCFLSLTQQPRVAVLEHAFEHGLRAVSLVRAVHAACFGFALGGANLFCYFILQRRVLLLAPLATLNQMLFETCDGIAQRPTRAFIGRAVACRIVAGGMTFS